MSGILGTASKTAWELVYRVSPILLTGGIASSLTSSFSSAGLFGSILSSITSLGIPIAAIVDPVGLLTDPVSLLSGNVSIDSLFAHFTPVPGGTLLEYETAKYPFANQTVAGNAVIQKELNISLQMECAYRGNGSMISRIASLAAMQATVAKHVSQGGRFTVLTPAMIYTDALLLRISDVSPDMTQPQTLFQWDFERPLITAQEASGAASTMMSKLSGGQVSSGSWLQAASGNPAASLLGSLF